MIENGFNPLEKTPERFPTAEEMRLVLQELIGVDYKITKEREDSQGLYYLEITTDGESKGETIEYIYIRKGHHHDPECECGANEIYINYYDHGIPTGGTSAARYINEQWKIF